ncbi:aldehyde dehydrogenase family protein [Streptomyces sp. NPDC059989]|uniref:aldehyde dehydrogenase family protein n=1 Tax=Streptomyces sp. NPDC059989 TaxID=3347026 RepID=UPI00369DEF49
MTEPLVLLDPRTGRRRGASTLSRASEVAGAVHACRSALPVWRALTPRARAERLTALADAIGSRAERFAAAERAGTGKPAAEAAGEVEQAVDLIRFYAQAARTELSPAAGGLLDGHESWVRWEPIGVVGVIVPWNYPLMMAVWRLAPALATGNTVVLKPAESTPDTALLMAELADGTLGSGVLTALTGDRTTGQLLVESDVDAVAFTGSVRGGTDVAVRAGLKRTSLELGGNCPVVVLPDAPEHAWTDIVAASVYNAGQSCAAPARVIVLAEHHDKAVEGLGAAMAAHTAGVHFGPLNNADQAARYDRILGTTRAKTVLRGEVEVPADEQNGFWRPAALLAGLPEDDPAITEEVFAPVLTVQPADSVEHAVELANSTSQALAASVWSSDLASALSLARRIDAGEVWVNCHLVQTAELPHGGRGASGHGTDLSVLALREYTRPKTITAALRALGASGGQQT